MLHKNNITKLVFLIVLFESIGFLLGSITQANIHSWYESLEKSSLTPPGFVFSIVWSCLYVLLACVAWLLLNQRHQASSKKMLKMFMLQMLMNWLWTPLFFELHWVTFSAIWLIGLTCLNLALIREAHQKNNKMIAWLLLPYAVWLIFASYLNGVIAL